MLDQDDVELHWNWEHTAYTCADMAEVAVRKKTLRLDRRYVPEKSAYQNYYGIRGIVANEVVRNRKALGQIVAPQSGIVYIPGSQVRIIVSRTVFCQTAKTLFRLDCDARTYSVPDSVLRVQYDALEISDVLTAIRLNKRMKDVDTEMLRNSTVWKVICTVEPNNANQILKSGDVSRTVVFPSGIQLEVSIDDWSNAWQATMVVPQHVREVNYLPIYKDIGLN